MVGAGLLKRLIKDNLPLMTIYDYGISEEFFDDSELRIFNFIKNFRETYGKYPTPATIAQECDYDSFERIPDEPLEYWINSVKDRRKQELINQLFKDIQKIRLKSDSKTSEIDLINKTYSELKKLETSFRAINLYEVQEKALEEHDKIQKSGREIYGIPFGLKKLDELTGGMRGGDFIFLVGETGVNKSYLSLFFGLNAYKQNYNVLYISPEMPEVQIGRRSLALEGRVKDTYLKKGLLDYYSIEKLKKIIEDLRKRSNWFKILPSGMFTNIHRILTYTSDLKPDLLIVDGIYLLKNPLLKTNTHWKEDESIVFLLRELSLKENIPILCTTQYSRSKKNKKEGARGTQSVEQTATLFLSLEYEFSEDKEIAKPQTTRLLTIKKGRDGERMVLRLIFDFDKSEIKEDELISGPTYLLDKSEEDNETDDFEIEIESEEKELIEKIEKEIDLNNNEEIPF